MLRHLSVGLLIYVLHAFATSRLHTISLPKTSLPFAPPILIDKTIGHQRVRGRGHAIAVFYKSHWNAILQPTRGFELDFKPFAITPLSIG